MSVRVLQKVVKALGIDDVTLESASVRLSASENTVLLDRLPTLRKLVDQTAKNLAEMQSVLAEMPAEQKPGTKPG